jgi:hypothetical protein
MQWVPSLSPGGKRPGRGVDPTSHLAPSLTFWHPNFTFKF